MSQPKAVFQGLQLLLCAQLGPLRGGVLGRCLACPRQDLLLGRGWGWPKPGVALGQALAPPSARETTDPAYPGPR